MKKSFLQAFPKGRHRKRKFRVDEIGFLIDKRKKLKLNPETEEKSREIAQTEEEIVPKTQHKHERVVRETIGEITGEDGKINANGLWNETRMIFPKFKDQVPIALEEKRGHLITNHNAIRKMALDAIVERLRKRPIHPNLKTLEKAKTRLTSLRLKIATRRKTPKWNLTNMESAIKSMKNNKCRDSEGLINELLKYKGKDFKLSLLLLLNNCKDQLQIPRMMKHVNVALIPKPGKKEFNEHIKQQGDFPNTQIQKPHYENATQ